MNMLSVFPDAACEDIAASLQNLFESVNSYFYGFLPALPLQIP